MPSVLSHSSRTQPDQQTLTQKRKKKARSLFLTIFEDVRKFMQTKLEKQLPENPVQFFDSLRDGVTLCELTNQLSPGSIPTIVKPNNLKYRAIDNIYQFLQYCEKQRGLRKESLFEPIDLYEKKNIIKVLLCLASISGNGSVQTGIEPKKLFDSVDTEVKIFRYSSVTIRVYSWN